MVNTPTNDIYILYLLSYKVRNGLSITQVVSKGLSEYNIECSKMSDGNVKDLESGTHSVIRCEVH